MRKKKDESFPRLEEENLTWKNLKFRCTGHSPPGADFFSTEWDGDLRVHANYVHPIGNIGGKWHCFVEGTEGAVFVNMYHVTIGNDPVAHLPACLEELFKAVDRQIARLNALKNNSQ
jgi:hypothetical protein